MALIREATEEDAVYVAPRLREADKQECRACLGVNPELVLPLSVRTSTKTWAIAHDDGEPFGLVGVDGVDQHPDFGIVWMVSTPDLFKYKRQSLLLSRGLLPTIHDLYPLIGNHVDARNTSHVRWLRALGFSFLKLHPKFGAEQRPFIEFAKLRNRPCV